MTCEMYPQELQAVIEGNNNSYLEMTTDFYISVACSGVYSVKIISHSESGEIALNQEVLESDDDSNV